VIAGGTQRMKWKTALTAEEAALLITGLSKYYSSLAQAKDDLASNEVTNPYDEYYVDYLNQKANFDEAVSLKEALWDEIRHAWRKQELGEGRGSILALDSWLYNDECCESLCKKSCKVTKESLAAWVYEMDGLYRARRIYLHFDPHNISNTKSLKNPTNEFSYDNYPVKLQLAISAHKYFWEEENAGDQRANSDVEAWLHKEAISLKIKHKDDGKPMSGISNKVKEVITQIIKPD
jgi:hypothetical protein|tara:strand:- start:29 stop:733 length:705 start_codon:yes stop_codon:yes gene_type:complete